MNKQESLKLANLLEDYQSLAKSHQALSFATVQLESKVEQLTERLDDCCSIKDLQDRAVAHKSLEDVVDKLSSLVDKIANIEKTHILHNKDLESLEAVKKELAKIKMYGYMVVGGVVTLEAGGAIITLLHKLFS